MDPLDINPRRGLVGCDAVWWCGRSTEDHDLNLNCRENLRSRTTLVLIVLSFPGRRLYGLYLQCRLWYFVCLRSAHVC